MKTCYNELSAYVTKDGSEIRELMHPAVHGGGADQSLAEAIIPAGQRTVRHQHPRSEEIYHVTHGRGWMLLDHHWFRIEPGDTVRIPPGHPHQLDNDGDAALRVLCICHPAYAHEDTELLDDLDESPQDHSC